MKSRNAFLCKSTRFLLVLSWLASDTNAFVLPATRNFVDTPTSRYPSKSKLCFHSHGNEEGSRRRKRDILRKRLRESSVISSGWRQRRKSQQLVSPSVALQNGKNDDDNSNNNKDDDLSSNKLPQFLEPYNQRLDAFLEKCSEYWQQLQTKFPFLKEIPEWFGNIRERLTWGVLSFVAGIVFTIGAIFIPVYNQVETLTEPVTLFETILSDLDRGYVEEVDTNKLFETGISAMLRSLDPYTEFEGRQQATDLTESIEGKYGGVGLVISGRVTPEKKTPAKLNVPADQATPVGAKEGDMDSMGNAVDELEDYLDEDGEEIDAEERAFFKKQSQLARDRGIHVVSAFEGYAFDYGMRVGDKLESIDDKKITADFTVEDVRNTLRGEPGTLVTISFTREGVEGVQSVTMPRQIVRVRDVKLATLLGDPRDGMGYIQLSGFASQTGAEMRNAILTLQQAALDASNGEHTLQGLVLDLRGNPGGLLTSAVDVSSLLVPKGSDIVSARGRGFPGVLYRSRVDPILDYSQTKLAVLVNDRTASAAEIVSGAIQDLDVGIIVGTDRTFGKGLVQNVEELPFDTALKFTVAKYYTPSGRCIQGIQYKEGGGLGANSRYIEKKVAEKDRGVFYTKLGRPVQDGGGIEADLKVAAPKASALEVTLLRSNMIADFAAQWSRSHELSNKFEVDDDTYREFQKFVSQKQQQGEIKLEALYNGPIVDLKKVLQQSGYKGSEKELDRLKQTIVREVMKDFDRYKTDIKEDITQSILARYLPESMLIERGVKTDVQVKEAVKLLSNSRRFDRILAKGSSQENVETSSLKVASTEAGKDTEGAKLNVKW
ncbi:CtpA-like serine protease [Seminavis robusta]|uniref:CtpA-like serine protease n=1 Tax=Seminavis robusta TaxID=568900 RepID=A0A9N8DYY7_9STRA|nr:CtpA-like serine protease [Seminavis robusta]|eukprot:Sro463_g148110.1 CtpA-like serine protease (831) ;mRNA; f:3737-6434